MHNQNMHVLIKFDVIIRKAINSFSCWLQRLSYQSNVSGDTLAVHLSDMGNKQVFTKTGFYKVGLWFMHPVILYTKA